MLEVLAYGLSLASLLLLALHRPIAGYLVGILDVIPWCLLAILHWDAPLMLGLEAVYLGVNLFGLVRALKKTPIHRPIGVDG